MQVNWFLYFILSDFSSSLLFYVFITIDCELIYLNGIVFHRKWTSTWIPELLTKMKDHVNKTVLNYSTTVIALHPSTIVTGNKGRFLHTSAHCHFKKMRPLAWFKIWLQGLPALIKMTKSWFRKERERG